MYKNFLKPVIDFIVALILLILASPFFVFSAVLLFFANRGKIFFVQRRPGRDEKIFKLIKFKTMNDAVGPNGELLPDEQRLTKAGKLVRSTSFDELPQLLNVLKGDMSLIGPRPWLVDYLAHYNDFQRRRHEVRPGITGWSQVHGRNTMNWDDRFKYDVYYVDNISFALDLKIFFLTIWKILHMEGISSDGSATMHRFDERVETHCRASHDVSKRPG